MNARLLALSLVLGGTAHAQADQLLVAFVIDESATAGARLALQDAGVPYGETAIVVRAYVVFDAPGGAEFNSVEGVGVVLRLWDQPMKFYQDPMGSALPPTMQAIEQSPTVAFDTYITLGETSSDDLPGVFANLTESEFEIVGDLFDAMQDPNIGPADTPLGKNQWGTLIFQATLLGACPDNFPPSGSLVFSPFQGELLIGGHGASGSVALGVLSPPCLGNIVPDDDIQTVNGADLAALLATWGPGDACARTDLNVDGEVNGADLAALLANWGCEP